MSSAGASTWDLRPDLVFIDGSHIYEDALFHMGSWWRKLRLGGRMGIYDTAGTRPDVRNALRLFLVTRNLHLEHLTSSISWVRKVKGE